jgi:hypothetical protein
MPGVAVMLIQALLFMILYITEKKLLRRLYTNTLSNNIDLINKKMYLPNNIYKNLMET